jgi:hypothetical protein
VPKIFITIDTDENSIDYSKKTPTTGTVEPTNNYDHIKSMTLDEMARWLADHMPCRELVMCPGELCQTDRKNGCYTAHKEWLMQSFKKSAAWK